MAGGAKTGQFSQGAAHGHVGNVPPQSVNTGLEVTIPTTMLHIPALRLGKPYTSLEKTTLVHHVTGEPVARVSQVNGGLIARDLNKLAAARRELQAIPISALLEMC